MRMSIVWRQLLQGPMHTGSAMAVEAGDNVGAGCRACDHSVSAHEAKGILTSLRVIVIVGVLGGQGMLGRPGSLRTTARAILHAEGNGGGRRKAEKGAAAF